MSIRDIVNQDKPFLKGAAGVLGVHTPTVKVSSSQDPWPDLWTDGYSITVTQEWARQSVHERRKRLVHELLHLKGLNHGRIGRLNYSTYPHLDSYSRYVYQQLLRNPTRFGGRRGYAQETKTAVPAQEVVRAARVRLLPIEATGPKRIIGPTWAISALRESVPRLFPGPFWAVPRPPNPSNPRRRRNATN